MSRVEFDDDRDSCTIYKFTREDVDAVNVTNWHDRFRELTPKTILLPIPPEVLKYLKSDGMVMPQNTHTTAHLNLKKGSGATSSSRNNCDEEDDDEDDNGSWASISDNEEAPGVPSEFLQKISRSRRSSRRGGEGSVEEEFGAEGDNDWDRQSASSDSSDEGQRKKVMEVEKFHEFDSLLDSSIKELGGAVAPKINRKSPRVSGEADVVWISSYSNIIISLNIFFV